MANLTQVLFGNREFGKVTYQENYDPQTLAASLGDTASLSESDVLSGAKPLSDSTALSDAITKLVETLLTDSATLSESRIMEAIHTLSDSVTLADAKNLAGTKPVSDLISLADSRVTTVFTKALSEITQTSKTLFGSMNYAGSLFSGNFTELDIFMRDGLVKQVLRALTETLSVSDSTVAIRQTKGLSDFILLKSWLRLDLKRATVWTASASSTLTFSMYGGDPLFGQSCYAATPKVFWANGSTDLTTWQKAVEITSTQSLFAKNLFGSPLYSAQPTTVWGTPNRSTGGWTNEDGTSNQE